MSGKAVFIGLGSALVEQKPRDKGEPSLVRYAARAIPLLRDAGFDLVIVAHEPAVALGALSEEDLVSRGRHLEQAIGRLDATLRGFYYCPHHPLGSVPQYAVDCLCRRPQPGLIVHAASELGIDLSVSWVIGDLLDDVEAGRRAGCRAVLVDTGSETEWRVTRYRVPHYLTGDLAKAARLIVATERKPAPGPRVGRRAS
jgi:D-glycero-D-manno-heptose 1,7-bisphosphate phosphatase